MSVTRCCEHCGAALPPRAPAGLCPKCLLGEAVRAAAEPAPAPPPSHASVGTHHPSLPTRFGGDYELLEKIATGGMGVVYKARQLRLNRIVALKMIPPGRLADEESVLRFQAEAEAAASLQHPHIVAIHETGECDGQHYFSMDYVAGQNLADAVRSQPLPPARAAQVLKAIAEAVHYAHQKGILHRDLKPSNIILDEAGEPRVTDFGLAKRLGTASELTLTGQVIGSPGFMPPEQAAGQQHRVDVRSDLYGLGAILYYVLTGRPPFQAATITDVLRQLAEAEPITPRLLNPSVPRDLATICLKCLEKDMPRRYPTAQALADELGRFLRGEPILARPIGPVGRAGRWCRRNPRLAGVTAVAVLSVALGLAGVLWQWRRAVAGELFARQNAYAADMKLAHLALLGHEVGLATTLLEKHRPAIRGQSERRPRNFETDLRHWEWRYLWRLCQGDDSSLLLQYPEPVRTLAVSRDGKLLALRNDSGLVALWDVAARRPLREFTNVASGAVALSPSGNLLAFSRREERGQRAVEVWDARTNRLCSRLSPVSYVRSLAFSPDETLLASFDGDGRIAVVQLPSKLLLATAGLPPRRGDAGVVAFSPDGSRLAVGEDFGGLQILDWRTGAALRIETRADEGVKALAYSPGGELLAVGFSFPNGTLQLWDPRSGQARGRLTNEATQVTGLAFSADGRLLAAADDARMIRVWSVADQTERCRVRAYRGGLRALAFLPDSRTLITGGKDGAVRLWDVTAARGVPGHTHLLNSYGLPGRSRFEAQAFARGTIDPRIVHRFGITFTPDGRSFLMPDKDGFVDAWEVRSAQRTGRLTALGSNNWDVALSPDGRWLAAGDITGNITVWDWPARRAVTRFALPFEWCGRLSFSRGGRFLLAATILHNHKANWRILRTEDWQDVPLPDLLFKDLVSAVVSPDERLLATGYENGAVRLWRFPTGQLEFARTNHAKRVVVVLFSPDGRTLFTSGDDDQVRFWDVAARRELGPYPGLSGGYGAAFSADGRRLVTGPGGRDAVKLWDLAAQRELLSLHAQGQYFFGFGFAPDGDTLMAISLDGHVHLWRAPSWEEIEAAENRAAAPSVSTEARKEPKRGEWSLRRLQLLRSDAPHPQGRVRAER